MPAQRLQLTVEQFRQQHWRADLDTWTTLYVATDTLWNALSPSLEAARQSRDLVTYDGLSLAWRNSRRGLAALTFTTTPVPATARIPVISVDNAAHARLLPFDLVAGIAWDTACQDRRLLFVPASAVPTRLTIDGVDQEGYAFWA